MISCRLLDRFQLRGAERQGVVSAAGDDPPGRIHRAYFYHASGENNDDLKQTDVLIFGLNDDNRHQKLLHYDK